MVSVIIVNYNTFELTCQCISSVIAESKGLAYEIILVDNASKEKDPAEFKQKFPSITLIKNEMNQGFGRANNQGMKIAKGEFILLLNSDTIVLDEAIKKCFDYLSRKADPSVGLIGCKQVDKDGNTLHSVFWGDYNFSHVIGNNSFSKFWRKLTGKKSSAPADRLQDNKVISVSGIAGSFMFLRKEVIEQTGMFDPDFFMYSEESEWCRNRIKPKFAIEYYPMAQIIHLVGKSAKGGIMIRQSVLSYALAVYKKSYGLFAFYLIFKSFDMVFLFLSDLLRKGKLNHEVRLFFGLFPYYCSILKYSNKYGARKNMLMLKELMRK